MALLQFRRNTASYWTAQGTVPQIGEPVYGTDTQELAVGDGATRWSALPKLLTDVRAASVYLSRALLGIAGGVATLDGAALLPAAQSRSVSITHGAAPGVARPAAPNGVPVLWFGSVRPTNAAAGDVVFLNSSTTKTVETYTGASAGWVVLGGGGSAITGTTQIATAPDLATALTTGATGAYDNVALVVVG